MNMREGESPSSFWSYQISFPDNDGSLPFSDNLILVLIFFIKLLIIFCLLPLMLEIMLARDDLTCCVIKIGNRSTKLRHRILSQSIVIGLYKQLCVLYCSS